MGAERSAARRTDETPSPAVAGAGPARVPHPASRAPSDVLAWQRVAGNRATMGLLAIGQPRLQVGPVGDTYEQEADQVARQVVSALQQPAASIDEGVEAGSPPAVRRRAMPVVGAEGGALEAGTEAAIESARGGGQPIDPVRRSAFEQAFGGADFSGVRLHTGAPATELNEKVQSTAFTVGSDIFFRGGAPDLASTAGQELLAHELTHTVQQSSAPPRSGATPGEGDAT